MIDPNPLDCSKFPEASKHSWTKMYPNAEEEIPYDMPTPKGKETQIVCYIDADHACDQVMHQSITGIRLFINGTPIKWMSKWQCTVETSTYGSEMVAMCIAYELIFHTHYSFLVYPLQ